MYLDVQKFSVFKITMHYSIQKKCIFTVMRDVLPKLNSVAGFLFFTTSKGIFSLILLCNNNFNLQSINKIIKHGIKMENESDENTNIEYFIFNFNYLFKKINNNSKKTKCLIYFQEISILQNLIERYTTKNKINFDLPWANFFTENCMNMLETILLHKLSKKIDNKYIINAEKTHVNNHKYKKRNYNRAMCLRENIKIILIISIFSCPIIILFILLYLKYIQIKSIHQ